MRRVIVAVAMLGAGLSMASAEETTVAAEGNAIGTVQTEYSCDLAESLHFDQAKYNALTPSQQVTLDVKFHGCRIAKLEPKDQPADIPVLMANPVATSADNRVLFGTIKRTEIEKAKATCGQAGGAAGIALTIAAYAGAAAPAAETIGSAMYEYSQVSCDALGTAMANDNLLLMFGPTQIVAHAVATKVASDVINAIPLVSSADKKNLEKIVEKSLTPPSVTDDGKNVTIKGGVISVSVRKPRVRIKW